MINEKMFKPDSKNKGIGKRIPPLTNKVKVTSDLKTSDFISMVNKSNTTTNKNNKEGQENGKRKLPFKP